MTLKLTEWRVADYLRTAEERAFYLNASVEAFGDNSTLMVQVLRDIASAQGVDDLATFAGLDPASLADGCEMSFVSFLKATQALGIQLHAAWRPAHGG
jgi:probable addiction module antidote protein